MTTNSLSRHAWSAQMRWYIKTIGCNAVTPTPPRDRTAPSRRTGGANVFTRRRSDQWAIGIAHRGGPAGIIDPPPRPARGGAAASGACRGLRAEERLEPLEIWRLRDVGVEPRLDRPLDVLRLGVPAHRDEPHAVPVIPAQLPGHLVAAHAGEPDVAQHDVEAAPARLREAARAVERHVRVVSEQPDEVREGLRRVGVVVQ